MQIRGWLGTPPPRKCSRSPVRAVASAWIVISAKCDRLPYFMLDTFRHHLLGGFLAFTRRQIQLRPGEAA